MSNIRVRKMRLLNNKSYCSKQKTRQKPEWDSSISDLSVYRSTREEMNQRKLNMKSQNSDILKNQLFVEKLKKICSKKTSNKVEQNAIIRELLSNEKQLCDILDSSELVLDEARGLLNTEPMRYKSALSITRAPIEEERVKYNTTQYANITPITCHPTNDDNIYDSDKKTSSPQDHETETSNKINIGKKKINSDEYFNLKEDTYSQSFESILSQINEIITDVSEDSKNNLLESSKIIFNNSDDPKNNLIGISETMSTFTFSLLKTLFKMATLLKEMNDERKIEMKEKENLLQNVSRLNETIDILTIDMLAAREDYVVLQDKFQKHVYNSNMQLKLICDHLRNKEAKKINKQKFHFDSISTNNLSLDVNTLNLNEQVQPVLNCPNTLTVTNRSNDSLDDWELNRHIESLNYKDVNKDLRCNDLWCKDKDSK